MSRWPLDLEDVLLELEPTSSETSIASLAARLGVSTAQLRSTALRLQRMSLVTVTSDGVSLTHQGRQKLARLEMARASVLRRIAEGLDAPLTEAEAKQVITFLHALLERTEAVVERQLGGP
jgi:Mn-dependent DtxR family transcriptional regulator